MKIKKMLVFNILKNFFIFLKNKIVDVKFLFTIMLSSLVILELSKFFNINLDYFYHFALTPAIWLVYIAYDKFIVPIIARIIMKFFNLNEYHNYISSIITICTRLFILYNGGMGYFICIYFSYFIETYNISLIPVFDKINKNIFETIYNSNLFNNVNNIIINMFNNINKNIIEIIYNLFNIINNNIINIFYNINNNIIKTIHNLNLFNENNNIINIFKNINKNIFETMYKININININNIFNNIFNNTNSFYLIIDKNIIINIINELLKNKLYLNGFDDYVYHNDLNIKIVTFQTGTPENIETSSGNESRSVSVSSNQESQPVANIISNNPIHLPSPPYTNENLIKWGINELNFTRDKFDDLIAPYIDPNRNVPVEIFRDYMHNTTPRSVLVYLNKTFTMSRIEIDESKVFSLYNEIIKKYYDPIHSIWWDDSTGRWIDSDLYYIRGDIKIDQTDYKLKTSKNKYTILFINRAIKNLSFGEDIKKLLTAIAEWNIVHLNVYEYVRSNLNSYKFTSIEEARSHMLSLNESTVKSYAQKLWCVDRPVRFFDNTVAGLVWKKSQFGVSKQERENISILIDQIIALKCQTMILNKNLSNYYLLLEKDYRWLQSSQVYMSENDKILNSMYKKPSYKNI